VLEAERIARRYIPVWWVMNRAGCEGQGRRMLFSESFVGSLARAQRAAAGNITTIHSWSGHACKTIDV